MEECEAGVQVAAVIEQARRARVALVARKKILLSAEMVSALGVSARALHKAVQSGRMFAVEVESKQYYPGFFADTNLSRRQLGNVSRALGDLPGWSKHVFFTTPKHSLGKRTPLEALKHDMYERVLRAAAGAVER